MYKNSLCTRTAAKVGTQRIKHIFNQINVKPILRNLGTSAEVLKIIDALNSQWPFESKKINEKMLFGHRLYRLFQDLFLSPNLFLFPSVFPRKFTRWGQGARWCDYDTRITNVQKNQLEIPGGGREEGKKSIFEEAGVFHIRDSLFFLYLSTFIFFFLSLGRTNLNLSLLFER